MKEKLGYFAIKQAEPFSQEELKRLGIDAKSQDTGDKVVKEESKGNNKLLRNAAIVSALAASGYGLTDKGRENYKALFSKLDGPRKALVEQIAKVINKINQASAPESFDGVMSSLLYGAGGSALVGATLNHKMPRYSDLRETVMQARDNLNRSPAAGGSAPPVNREFTDLSDSRVNRMEAKVNEIQALQGNPHPHLRAFREASGRHAKAQVLRDMVRDFRNASRKGKLQMLTPASIRIQGKINRVADEFAPWVSATERLRKDYKPPRFRVMGRGGSLKRTAVSLLPLIVGSMVSTNRFLSNRDARSGKNH